MKLPLLIFTKAIGDPTRLQILQLLKKECCVGELWKKLDLSQNLVSHHLKILKEAKLISSEKRGMKVVYRLEKEFIAKQIKLLNDQLS
jgi:DNA-binding transcriptional ArsR family regulator